jgi:hypothetical protein
VISPVSGPLDETSAYGVKADSKNCLAAASSPFGSDWPRAQARLSAAPVMRGQPARKARRLGSSAARLQPGSASNGIAW